MHESDYQAIYTAVYQIDRHVTKGTAHFRDTSGQLLQTLEEVIRAILEDRIKNDEL